MEQRIDVVKGDITQLRVDYIVNAANKTLLGGGGVDGAIHRAAGRELLEYCRKLPEEEPGVRCQTGEAVLTPAFRLQARAIIHTVGPVWHGGKTGEPELLSSCYEKSLKLAQDDADSPSTIAFPAISCGIYRFPHERAADIAVRTLRATLPQCPRIESVHLVAYSPDLENVLHAAVEGA